MNQERIRERKGTFNGHEHNHAGQASHQRRMDAANAQVVDLIEGNIPTMFDEPHIRPLEVPRSATIYEIGKRAMRRITRDGRR